MSYFQNDDVRIFYTDTLGSGTVVLLLHGWTCDSHDWSWQIPALVAANFRVIAVDHRGHGRSSAPFHISYTPQTLAKDAAALLDHLRIPSAVVIGHSMGTVIASALDVQRPDLVSALVLVDPVYNVPHALMGPFIDAIQGPSIHAVVGLSFRASFYTAETPAWLKTWHERRMLGTPAHVIRDCIVALYGGEADSLGNMEVSSEYLKQRKASKLAVYATEEKTALERSLPVGPLDEIHVIPAGHFLHQQRSEEFNKLLLKWLEKGMFL